MPFFTPYLHQDLHEMAIRWEQIFENNRKDLEKFQCPRCDYLLRDPVQQMSCGHWLCECCAKELDEAVSPRCPRLECQEPWNKDEEPAVRVVWVFLRISTIHIFLPQYFPDRFVRKSLGKFSVKCGNAECNWVGTVESLSQHLAECAHRKTQCLHCLEWLPADKVHLPELRQIAEKAVDVISSHRLKPTKVSVQGQWQCVGSQNWVVTTNRKYVYII